MLNYRSNKHFSIGRETMKKNDLLSDLCFSSLMLASVQASMRRVETRIRGPTAPAVKICLESHLMTLETIRLELSVIIDRAERFT